MVHAVASHLSAGGYVIPSPLLLSIKAVIESLPPLFDLNIKVALGEVGCVHPVSGGTSSGGDGFNNTLRIVGPIANRYVSLADVLALATIAAIENCSGPSIPFRSGHINVLAPNAPGVPQPQEDLATHTATFKRQGFSKMIGLLACVGGEVWFGGHTFGGVAHPPFPDLVPDLNDTSNTQSVAHFDGTPVGFDNSVTNTTTNSDMRIFRSDGGKVMRGEVLMPLPAKLDALQLTLDGDKLLFVGEVRVREWLSMSGTVIQCLLGVIQADGVVLRVDLACFMISNQVVEPLLQ
ncbi:heme peroxidase [Mycena olivaceomarginata]|nr:heme peroxidase [Mycena olivaceomarginata]